MLDLLAELITCQSLSPNEAGSLAVVSAALPPGFTTEIIEQPIGVRNLVATYKAPGQCAASKVRHLCFAGHVDVVPAGDHAAWTVSPFAGSFVNETIYGRGACDMKGSIAAFVDACRIFLAENPSFSETISIILTADEETAGHGMEAVMEYLAARRRTPDVCLVGEPTSDAKIGDTIKYGRRGSLTATLTVQGKQGHVAYPHLADNPVPRLTALLQTIQTAHLDDGTDDFQPSKLEIVSLWTSSNTSNVIPASASALLNIRYNIHFTQESIATWLRDTLDRTPLQTPANAYTLTIKSNNRPFVGDRNGTWTNLVEAAVQAVTQTPPILSTSGGTSDARTIHPYCQVVELGLLSKTAHHVDEQVPISDLISLRSIYVRILELYFVK